MADRRTIESYEADAERYATDARNARLTDVYALFASRLPAPARILDAGCGSGRDVAHLETMGYNVVGMDQSLQLLRIARRSLRAEAALVCGDLERPPFGLGSFDGVWAVASLLHVRRRRVVPTVEAVAAAVRPGGWLLTSMKLGSGSRRDPNGRLVNRYSETQWSDVLHRAGWCEAEQRRCWVGDSSPVEWLVTIAHRQ